MHLNNQYELPNGRRYSDLEKDICAFEYLTAGNAHYSYLLQNMSIAAKKTVQRHLKNDTNDLKEGEINAKGLKEYLMKNNFPFVVALCEDATRITPAIQYDFSNDCLRGLVSPFDENGLPTPNTFIANSPNKMISDIKTHPVGNYAYLQMAVPLCKEAAPFVLFHCCSDNRFTYENVEKRLTFTEELLRREGILVVSIASDGDSRLLKFMKKREGFDTIRSPSRWGDWFIADDKIDTPLSIQDMTHTVNKLRNRFAHSNKQPDLLIGNKLFS